MGVSVEFVVVMLVENGLREGRILATAGSWVKPNTDRRERHERAAAARAKPRPRGRNFATLRDKTVTAFAESRRGKCVEGEANGDESGLTGGDALRARDTGRVRRVDGDARGGLSRAARVLRRAEPEMSPLVGEKILLSLHLRVLLQ